MVQLILVSKDMSPVGFFVFGRCDKTIPINILWDSGALESLIVESGLLFPCDTDTGDFVLGRRMMVLPVSCVAGGLEEASPSSETYRLCSRFQETVV